MNERLRRLIESITRVRSGYRACCLDSKTGQLTRAGEIMLADLRRFCRATTTPAVIGQNGMVDPIATGIAIGRLEVWHRFRENLYISDADLTRLVEQSEKDRDQ